ncbi:MAG: chemotaxis protein CheC [Firmicutes bacterium]|nr:chemotaxis protein CheC [Bacillota bacterium]
MSLGKAESQELMNLVDRAMARACSGLSDFVGSELKIESLSVSLEPAERLPSLFGGAETPVAAIYVPVNGMISGHAVLFFDLDTAFTFLDCLFLQPQGTAGSFDPLHASALCEVGNITASAFLSELADTTNLEILPSPPAFTADMVGAILNWLAPELFLWEAEVLVIKTNFIGTSQRLKGFFLFLPAPGSVEKILATLR